MGRPKKLVGDLSPEVLKIIGKHNKLKANEWIPTGLYALDLMIGNGIPRARAIEVYGSESAGKSRQAWITAASVQKLGGIVMLADTEATAPKLFMEQLGVNTEQVIMLKGRTVEEIRDAIQARVKELRESGFEGIIFVIWDSIAATSAEGEWESLEDWIAKDDNIGSRAKSLSEFFRKFTLFCKEFDVTLFLVNQLRDKIGVMYGLKEDSPGGRALKFHTSVRIRINKGAQISLKEKMIGYTTHYSIQKNKVGPASRKTDMKLLNDGTFDPYDGLLDVLIEAGRVKPIKGEHKFEVGPNVYEENEVVRACQEHPELLKEWLNGNTNPEPERHSSDSGCDRGDVTSEVAESDIS